jgi:hypothetical protein
MGLDECLLGHYTTAKRCRTPKDIRHYYRSENIPEDSVLRLYMEWDVLLALSFRKHSKTAESRDLSTHSQRAIFLYHHGELVL